MVGNFSGVDRPRAEVDTPRANRDGLPVHPAAVDLPLAAVIPSSGAGRSSTRPTGCSPSALEDLSLEDIAAAAGVTRGLVHHYFWAARRPARGPAGRRRATRRLGSPPTPGAGSREVRPSESFGVSDERGPAEAGPPTLLVRATPCGRSGSA